MNPPKVISAEFTQDGAILLELNQKAKQGPLESKYFVLENQEGAAASTPTTEFIGPKEIRVEIPDSLDTTKGLTISYKAPPKDLKTGVIQNKKGVDARTFSAVIEPVIPEPDPLTNAWIYNGNTYQLIKEPKTWLAAKEDSITRGGYLVEVDDLPENEQLFTQLKSRISNSELNQTKSTIAGGRASYVWLGGSDIDKEGVWIWANSGKAIPFETSPWGAGALGNEPDNFDDQDGLAIGLQNWPVDVAPGKGFGLAGQWNDQTIRESYYYVIEFNKILPIA